jgi:radical SAM protein with 4Fe4S-binding SPASM domain
MHDAQGMEDANPPRFSVVLPVWNRAALVVGAIESALRQTNRDFELLVVDDGSTDALDDAVDGFRGDPRLRLLRLAHAGVCAARNAGIRAAAGSLIAYLDSDNRWRPEFLERMGDALEASASRLVYCDLNLYRRIPLTRRVRFAGRRSPTFCFSALLDDNCIDINTLVHQRSLVDEVGWWDEQLERMNDWDFILRLTSRVAPRHVPEALVDYYSGVSRNSITATRPAMPAGLRIEEKHRGLRKPTITHDTITYTWDRLAEPTYYNWVRFTKHSMDRETFRAACLPCIIQIEPTNHCNLGCPLCPAGRNELGRVRRHMTLGEFRGIVDDAQEYLMLLVLWNWGEPFLNPALPDMIAYAAAREIRTVTSTNAQFLGDEAYVERILTSGLSTLIIAIDSLDETSYRAYRQGGDLSRAITGLERLVAMKRRLRSRTLLNLRMVVMRHNEDEIAAFTELGRRLGVDCLTVKTINPSCGAYSSDEALVPLNPKLRRFVYRTGTWERIPKESICERVWMMSNILADGDVVPCCYDFDASMAVGNAFRASFTGIWNSPEYAALRRRVLLERAREPHCRECHTSYKMARAGDWFVDRIDFNMPSASTAQYKLRMLLRNDFTYRAWRLVRSQLRPFVR